MLCVCYDDAVIMVKIKARDEELLFLPLTSEREKKERLSITFISLSALPVIVCIVRYNEEFYFLFP